MDKATENFDKTNALVKTSTYSIEGMTCDNCAKTITEKISTLKNVISVDVNRTDAKVDILASQDISLLEVKNVLSDLPKYKVFDIQAPAGTLKKVTPAETSFFVTYKPLIIVFVFIFLVSLASQASLASFNSHLFMNHIMAGFFIGFSFFKFLDLAAFSESFSSYDPVAQRWQGYGKAYPFIELLLGLMYVIGQMLVIANIATILVLSFTTYGVYKRLQSKSPFQCACLGTTFNLPLSNVTIGENVVMILMAAFGLFQMY